MKYVWIILVLALIGIGCSSSTRNSAEKNTLSLQQPFKVPGDGGGGTTTLCGNGIVEAGEDCDGGSCCDLHCRVIPAAWNIVCDPVAGTLCSGASPECGTQRTVSTYSARIFDPRKGLIP